MTREEQETVIRFDATKGDVEAYTADPSFARRMERFGFKAYRTTTIDGKLSGWFYRVPYSALRFPFGRKKHLSEEAKARMAARLAAARADSSRDLPDARGAGRDNMLRTGQSQGREV